MFKKIQNPLKISILGSTNGTDMQAIIESIENKTLFAEIVLVISNKKNAFILERAKKKGIETFFIDYNNYKTREEAEKEMVFQLKNKKIELILLIGWMKILTNYFISQFENKIWNIHPSLLPKYSGGMDLQVHKEVLKNKEKESGCTLHKVTNQVDKGEIILQKKIEIMENETEESLKKKIQILEQECILESLQNIINGKILL